MKSSHSGTPIFSPLPVLAVVEGVAVEAGVLAVVAGVLVVVVVVVVEVVLLLALADELLLAGASEPPHAASKRAQAKLSTRETKNLFCIG
jgi:hypothetical protein